MVSTTGTNTRTAASFGDHGYGADIQPYHLRRQSRRQDGSRLCVGLIAACPFPASHGTPGGIREKAEALVELGHEVHVITYASHQPEPVRGVKIHRIAAIGPVDNIVVGPSTAKMYWDVLLTLKTIKVVRDEQIDILHGINYEGAMVGCIAKWLTGCPLVYGAVNTMIDELPSYKFIWPPKLAKILATLLDRGVPRQADCAVCYTETIRDFLLDFGVCPSRLEVVKLGIDLSMFVDAQPGDARERMGVGQDQPLVVYTGVLNKFQRIDYLIQAMKVVLAELPDAKCAFVRTLDDEEHRLEVEQMARAEGVLEAMVFPPVIKFEELPAFIAAADTSAVPRPDCPGVPVKLLNFMAAGKPVVVTHGSSQGLRDGHEALVTADHDPEAMGKALLKTLTDRQLAARLGQQARQLAYSQYDRAATTRDLVNVYRRVLARRGRLSRLVGTPPPLRLASPGEVQPMIPQPGGAPAVARARTGS